MEIACLELNDTRVDNVIVEGLSSEVRCGSAVLHDVRAILELNFTVHWSYVLKWLRSESGIKALGSKANAIELYDIRLPMLQDFRFEIPEAELEASARIQSVSAMSIRSSININGLSMEELVLQDAQMNSDKLNQTAPD